MESLLKAHSSVSLDAPEVLSVGAGHLMTAPSAESHVQKAGSCPMGLRPM